MPYLLDTNIIIAFFAQETTTLDRIRSAYHNDTVYIPSVVLGELYYGALKSAKVHDNVARVDDLAGRGYIIDCDSITARYYGSIKDELRQVGKPIPDNDIWIAAIAKQRTLTLVTRDAHF